MSNSKKKPGRSKFSFGSGSRKGFVSNFQTKDTEKESDSTAINTPKEMDVIYHKSSESMPEINDNSIALTVTSPPYNIDKDSDESLTSLEYWDLMNTCFSEVYRSTQPGGRLVVNIANLGRKPYQPLNKQFTDMLINLGFLMRGEIIWQKSKGANANFAWGSWMSASNPVLRDIHEYCLVFSKESFKRQLSGESTISKEDFMESTLSIWNIAPERARKIGHPAPFPVELPKRFVELYSFKDEVILDPFIGSGTTAIAAKSLNRHYIGYEINSEYIELANTRLAEVN
ncbi:MAG: site-specific DNA-methyltransferase [Candidatus Actinomarinales bacterium]|nr:MAG: site-specific DNA-methyltransferase [Candidatus Actinomarinales bacterium]